MNVAREAQLLLEPAFFWFIIAGGTGIVVLAIIKLIELLSKEKMLFEKAKKKQNAEDAIDKLR